MFLSKRERPPDKSSPSSNKPSASAYQCVSIPPINVVALSAVGVPGNPSTPRRAPLAPLDPQIASNTFLDDQMPSSSANQASSQLDRSTFPDGRDVDSARAALGRQIIARPHEDESEQSAQSSRKRSLSGHGNGNRSLPYPPSRPVQRRPSNTPSISPSSTRRPSVPGIQIPSHGTPSLSLPPPPSNPFTDSSFVGGEDIYSGLSTFRFGAPKPSSSSQTLDTSDMISPLTRVPGSGSADRTPRPSVSGASSGGRRKSHSSKTGDPAEGDDEYEDEDDETRSKTRSKMRAIDDGTRRPSLPTNSLIPTASASTASPPSSFQLDNEASPGGRSSQSQESDFESSEAEGDEPETAEFDTDVELDLPAGSAGDVSMDPPVSDAASQRTFGVGTFDHYGYFQRFRPDGEPNAPDDEEEDVGSISPVTFNRGYDSEGYDDGDRPLPLLPTQQNVRRGSSPWEGLSPRTPSGGREREDSAMTVTPRRPSRSTDDLLGNNLEPTQPTRFDDLNPSLNSAPHNTAAALQNPDNAEYNYDRDWNMEYIMEGLSRKSWASDAPSYVRPGSQSDGDPSGLGAAWDEDYRAARRPSSATVGSSEDAFNRHLRTADPEYTAREERWSFRKESSDGRGPHRMQLTSPSTPTPPPPGPSSFTMTPGTQELWRQEYVGRYKVDRMRISPEGRGREKGLQQRLHIRHIADPYLKTPTHSGPHGVVHKHSKVVAFSLFRHNNVLPVGNKKGESTRTPFDRSGGILLANKRVQEAYTSTHTTSRLNSHGLLADSDARGYDGTTIVSTAAAPRQSSRPSTPQESRQNEVPQLASTHTPMDTSRDSVSPPPPPPKDGHDVGSPAASSPEAGRDSDSQSTRAGPSSLTTRSSTLFNQTNRSRSASHSSVDTDDSDSPPRTSHAEAFATVDSSYFDAMRHRPVPRSHEEPQSKPRLGGALRKFFGPQKASSSSASASASQWESNYTPPWLTLAPRSKQEESQRVIQNLNESFQDVGLLPTNTRASSKHKNKGKARQDHRENQSGSILEKVPKDSLYMLLPLWPGETDATTAKLNEDPTLCQLRIEDRQYLLVYYVPFEEKEKRANERNKKRSRGTKSPTNNPTGSVVDTPLFLLRSFRVNARLVAYDDLRNTGVRVPSYGLTINGSMAEAMRYLPSPSIREQKLDEVVICHCTNRNTGMKFDPDGLTKLGLCMPTDKPAASQIPDSVIPEQEEAVLTPIGRAAVEMAWLGCMAVTSFGTV